MNTTWYYNHTLYMDEPEWEAPQNTFPSAESGMLVTGHLFHNLLQH